MKHLKSYNIFESTDLKLGEKLAKYNITKYILNEDGSIDVGENVTLNRRNLLNIPFKFNKVDGWFDIQVNSLTTLKNCPKYISTAFFVTANRLNSLEYGPEYVGNNYWCDHNRLVTLKGCVDEVYNNFDCSNNKLFSLEFCPMEVEGFFNCSNNRLTELDRSPFIRSGLICTGMFKLEPIFNGHCENLVWR